MFGLSECKHLASGGKGVILMDLDKAEKLITAIPISQKGVTIHGIGRAAKVQELNLAANNLAPHIGKRARKGKALESKLKVTGLKAN